MLAVGQSLPFRARRLGVAAARRVAHARGAARARRARLRPRARAVRAQRGVGGAAPLARAQRRAPSTRPPSAFVSTQVARKLVELLFGRLDGRTASFAATRDLVERYFPGDYRVIHPGADLRRAPGSADERRDRPRSSSRPRRSAARCGCSCARCGGCRRRSTGARRSGRATRPRRPRRTLPRRLRDRVRSRRPGRRLARRSTWRAPTIVVAASSGRGARAAAAAARAWPAGRCRWPRGCRTTRRLRARGRARAAVRAARRRHARRPARAAAARRRRCVGRLRGARSRSDRARARLVARGRRARGALRARSRRAGTTRTASRELRKRLGVARLRPRGPAHAHRPLARLRDAGGHAARDRQGASAWARSP